MCQWYNHIQKVKYFTAKFSCKPMQCPLSGFQCFLPKILSSFGLASRALGWRSALMCQHWAGRSRPSPGTPQACPLHSQIPVPHLSVKETTQASRLLFKEVSVRQKSFKFLQSFLSFPRHLHRNCASKRKKEAYCKDDHSVLSLEISTGFQQSHLNMERGGRNSAGKSRRQALGSESFVAEVKK